MNEIGFLVCKGPIVFVVVQAILLFPTPFIGWFPIQNSQMDIMKKLNKWLVVVAMLMTTTTVKAQDVSPLAFMRLNPYQTNLNVATDLPYTCYFSPGIGNFGVNMQYSSLGIIDLFKSKFSLMNLLDLLEDDNYFAINASHNLNTLGIRAGNGTISYNHNFRVIGYTSFNYCLFKLMALGNKEFLGEDNPATVRFDWDTQMFHEYALGYQLNVTDWLSIGARAKLLFGIADLSTDAFEMMLYTDPDDNTVYFKEDVTMRFSLPRKFQLEDGSMTANGPFGLSDFYHNPGFGIDLGISARINERFAVTAAVNDIGHIRWKQNNMRLTGRLSEDGAYYEEDALAFDGIDAEHLKRFFKDKEYRNAVMDTLSDCFDFQTNHWEPYNTKLPTSFLVRGSFDLTENHRFITQFQGCFRSDGFRPAFTMAYNGCFLGKFDISGTCTMMRGSLLNLGAGIGFKFGAFQMYVATSNFLNLKVGGQKSRNYQAGIVFTIGPKDKDMPDDDDDDDDDDDGDDDDEEEEDDD